MVELKLGRLLCYPSASYEPPTQTIDDPVAVLVVCSVIYGAGWTGSIFGTDPKRAGCQWACVGLCDEFPLITYPEDYEEGAFDYVLQPGMTLCVEALISRENGEFSIKLEDQLLVTDS